MVKLPQYEILLRKAKGYLKILKKMLTKAKFCLKFEIITSNNERIFA